MIRVVLPAHLKNLARVGSEVRLEVTEPVTQRVVLDALEARFPMLRGTIRDHGTLLRRPMLRFFACEEDLSLESPDDPLPEAVASGAASASFSQRGSAGARLTSSRRPMAAADAMAAAFTGAWLRKPGGPGNRQAGMPALPCGAIFALRVPASLW